MADLKKPGEIPAGPHGFFCVWALEEFGSVFGAYWFGGETQSEILFLVCSYTMMKEDILFCEFRG